MGDKQMRAVYDRAVKAWNKDGGPIEKTVNAGEDLFFAGDALITELTEQNERMYGALVGALDSLEFAVEELAFGRIPDVDLEGMKDRVLAVRAAMDRADGGGA